ncbi:DUF202 domain-containing protein [Nocardia sp. NBC_01503]|uniref:DUF202 domain-containing protein n=1 Tax=Nocardia sp. NBC_01503 TaxID=2975997 RepID=UPI002E7AE2AA|nr:DUF202 domain-containing protein [Nocardia sp. NBC_01503]WTL31508.1 DUF202 domain-containing protein [Nocardia sp. NBC_01503]
MESPTATRDSGLATERTALAWRRTIASLCTATLLLAHQAVVTHSLGNTAAVSAAMVALLVVWVIGHKRNRHLRAGHTAPPATAIVATVCAVATVATVIAVTLSMSLLRW